MANIQILNKETLSDRKYLLQSVAFRKPDKDGNIKEQSKEVYFRPDAVAVLLVNRADQKLLLTRQFRMPTFLNGNESGYLVEACAGLIDEGETPEQTAIREVEEEMGYQISDLTKVAGSYSSAGGITEFVHFFIGDYVDTDKKSPGGGLAAEGEEIEVVELTFADANEKLKQGWFRDAKAIILLQYLFMNLS